MVSAGLLEYTVDVGEHVRGLFGGVHQMMNARECIILGQRTRLRVIRVQSLLQSIHIVVAASHQRLTSDL